MMRLIVRAFNIDGYHKDILVQDEEQVRMNESRVKFGWQGMCINPKDFPEMVRFEIIVESSFI